MRYTDDPPSDWDAFCMEQEREMQRLPICIECNERILDDMCYDFGDGPICDDCVRQYRKFTADLME